jgi:hypothetical protein
MFDLQFILCESRSSVFNNFCNNTGIALFNFDSSSIEVVIDYWMLLENQDSSKYITAMANLTSRNLIMKECIVEGNQYRRFLRFSSQNTKAVLNKCYFCRNLFDVEKAEKKCKDRFEYHYLESWGYHMIDGLPINIEAAISAPFALTPFLVLLSPLTHLMIVNIKDG